MCQSENAAKVKYAWILQKQKRIFLLEFLFGIQQVQFRQESSSGWSFYTYQQNILALSTFLSSGALSRIFGKVVYLLSDSLKLIKWFESSKLDKILIFKDFWSYIVTQHHLSYLSESLNKWNFWKVWHLNFLKPYRLSSYEV